MVFFHLIIINIIILGILTFEANFKIEYLIYQDNIVIVKAN